MSFGITKTIPAKRGQEGVDSLYDGSLKEFEFHMAGKPSKLNVGDYVYTIFNDQLVGRCQIKELIGGAINPDSGKPRTSGDGRLPRRTAGYAHSTPGTSRHSLL